MESAPQKTELEKDRVIENQAKKIKEYESSIKNLEAEVKLLKDDIDAADKKIEELTEKKQDYLPAMTHPIPMPSSNLVDRKNIIQTFQRLLLEAAHTVTICIPSISDLPELDLHMIKSSVNLKISCDIENGNKKHAEIMDEFKAMENVSFRIFDQKDRWSVIKDGDALFLAIIGKTPEKILGLETTDPLQIKFLNSVAMEAWLRGRKTQF
jgi:predicted RNase H-like nuclease (RuvC/YqgF family)